MRYRAFISYSHSDEQFAAWLHRDLERYRIPARVVSALAIESNRLGTVFRDRDELASSGDLTETIRAALAESRCLIVVCSEEAANSRWVNAEIEAYRGLHANPLILPIIADSVPAGSIGNLFPHALTADAEPLAADARSSGDGRRRARLKLIAGLIGTRFDDLVERDAVRSRQRMLSAAALLAVVVGGVTFLMDQARRSDQEAQAQKAQAAALIDYMVNDLTGRLAEYEKVGELDQGLSQALNYFGAFAADDLDDDTLRKYRTALIGVGSVRIRQGRLAEALENFERAMELSQVSTNRSANDAAEWYELAQNTYYVGEAHWEMQDIATAADYIERSLDYGRRAAALAPGNGAYRIEVVFGLNNMGAVYTRLKRYQDAIVSLETSLAENERLRTEFPLLEEDLLNQEVESVSWLAEIVPSLGDYEHAFIWHEREMSLREALYEQTGNIHHLARLSDALGYYARTLIAVGRSTEARAALERKVALSKELVREDPDNTFWRTRGHVGQAMLAVESFHAGDRTVATRELDVAEAGLEDLLAEERGIDVVSLHLAYVRSNRAYFSLAQPLEALALLEIVFEALEPGLLEPSPNPVRFDYYLRAVILESAALRRLGRAPRADRLRRALELMAREGVPEQSVHDAAMLSLLELARSLDGGRGKQDSSALLEGRGYRSEFYRRMRAALGA